jgi:NAD(P)H-dependent FMN reductase
MAKILAMAGSLREGSINKKLVRIAAAGATAAGAEVTLIDLRDFPLPLFDEDVEARGFPEAARKLKALFVASQGLLIASPEYNSSIPGVFKNAIDWVSRSESESERPLAAFKGKVVSLMSASPGGLGGIRGLVHVRAIFGNLGCIVLPDQVTVPKAGDAFDAEGRLKDAKQQSSVERLGRSLAEFVAKIL